MRLIVCVDCERNRDPYRPIIKLLDGTIRFTCRKCWKQYYDNGEELPVFMHALSVEDRAALVRLR